MRRRAQRGRAEVSSKKRQGCRKQKLTMHHSPISVMRIGKIKNVLLGSIWKRRKKRDQPSTAGGERKRRARERRPTLEVSSLSSHHSSHMLLPIRRLRSSPNSSLDLFLRGRWKRSGSERTSSRGDRGGEEEVGTRSESCCCC